ncbi:hypothetical protein Tco_0617122 [Tanacetum coccineum]
MGLKNEMGKGPDRLRRSGCHGIDEFNKHFFIPNVLLDDSWTWYLDVKDAIPSKVCILSGDKTSDFDVAISYETLQELGNTFQMADLEIFDIVRIDDIVNQQGTRRNHRETEKQRLEIESLKPLQDKINELERDCNELTHENLDLVSKLKESSKNLSACVDSNEDSEVNKLEYQIQQLKEEAKKRELDRIDAGYL